MKRNILFSLFMLCFCLHAKADHITGGEMFYIYMGQSGGNHNYNVTLRLYMRCNSGRQFNNPTIIGVFDRATNERVTALSVPLASEETISITDPNPCITNPPTVCYEIGTFNFQVSV